MKKKTKTIKSLIIPIIILIIIGIICTITINSLKPKDNNEDNSNDEESYEIKEKYECNEFSYTILLTEEISQIYLNDYKDKLINNPKDAYNHLNAEYRDIYFKNYEDFEKYINTNIEEIKLMTVTKYTNKNYEDFKQYTCMDQYGNIYVFDITSVMNYTVKLDTYSIDSDNFINEYNNSNEQGKVVMNVKKIFNAINYKGYEYVYNKLDQEFKENNFKTLEDFKKYINNNLYTRNQVSITKFSNEGDTYICAINVKDDNNRNKDMTLAMKLKENRDFAISFSFE